MGRSRGNFKSTDEDITQRSKGKKKGANGENSKPSSAGQGSSAGKRPLYHCNYCNKDITGKVRFKCAVCTDFDLCVECFSVGAEVTPHKSNHPYRVMEALSFALFSSDWSADEESLLLEGLEMYGFGNWAEVAEHVGTKSKETCIEHYDIIYLKSPSFPLPDMSHVVGKSKEELLAMAKGHSEDKIGASKLGELTLKEESTSSFSRVKTEETHKSGTSGRSSTLNSDPQVHRNAKGKKPTSSGNKGPSLMELSGYNPKRQEFDIEYDNDAEQLVAEMEFKDTDTAEERELKLRVLLIYSKRLDERQRRKDFILERNLLYPSSFEKDLTPEERELCRRYDTFMRFHSKEEHEELLQVVVEEHRMLKRIEELKEAQAAGCHTSAEADRYLEQKRRKEAEENSRTEKDNTHIGLRNEDTPNAFMRSESAGKDSSGQSSSSYTNNLDVTGHYEAQLLSETEKRLCCEIHLSPPVYLKMQELMAKEIFSGNITKKLDARPLFKIEASKVDRVYDMLVKKGIAQP